VDDPDALLIQDPTLLHRADLFAGLKPGGFVLVNSFRGFGELGLADFAARHGSDRFRTLPASNLALAHLGRPLPGAPMLGGLAALTGVVGLDAVLAAIADRFTGKVAAGNAAAARAAFEFVAADLAREKADA
jgi:pyruvate ferredoxin oxidoreductase gamma subunit